MGATTIRAHFDGNTIILDEPVQLQPDTRLIITIVSPEQAEQIEGDREEWFKLAQTGLAGAYGDNEPEYTLDMIKEPNPDYEGR